MRVLSTTVVIVGSVFLLVSASPGAEAKPGPKPGPKSTKEVPPPRDSTGLIPLTEMGAKTYKGEDGGLYGGGKNDPPAAHVALAQQALRRIQPLDAEGKPSPQGKIVLMSIGMSNTTAEFQVFVKLANASPLKAANVVVVDTAQGSRVASSWANSERAGARSSGGGSVWDEAERRFKAAGVTPQQVQVAWCKVASSSSVPFPVPTRIYQGHLAKIATVARSRYPNLQIMYLSSRIYAGYATTTLNPEPWAYEAAFGNRWVIQQQISGDPALNADPGRGPVKSPVLLWGPYLWVDGMTPRKSDGLVWRQSDLARDGIHPSSSGTRIVANDLLAFFTTNPLARSWFTGRP